TPCSFAFLPSLLYRCRRSRASRVTVCGAMVLINDRVHDRKLIDALEAFEAQAQCATADGDI
ncbi:hypothetical protein, partial [Paraburkholderia sp. BR13444]|uniref:hypothetical protein n=1 Tax=Paraburkholderia sp. BR13444 TaxID=3236997 RepID=UPI0034CFDC5F